MTREEKIALLKDIINGEIINPAVRKNIGVWAIKELEREPKTGHWINEDVNGLEYYRCSECRSSPWDFKTKCCPDCGAKMEV